MSERNSSQKEYVGYGVPPKHSRFKVGNREYLKRRKKTKSNVGEEVRAFLVEKVGYRQGRKAKRGRRIDIYLLKNKTAALKGDLAAAASLIEMRENPANLAVLDRTILILDEVD